ncbi:MAG: long-chain fatty acid--CoA ligase [Candidatus Atabeyarchaeum deiterrae]
MSDKKENPYASKPWLKIYDDGVPAHIDYPEIPVHELLDRAAKDFGGRTAIHFLKRGMSYKEVKDITDRLATALVNLGVKKGDVVAVLFPNFPQYIFSYYGISKSGGVITACSTMLTEPELAFQLNDSGAETIIAWDRQLEKIKNIKDRTRLRNIIISDVFDYSPAAQRQPPEIVGAMQFLNLVNRTKPNPPKLKISAKEDVAALQYTGGTTGLPKGAMLTHYNLVSNAVATATWLPGVQKGKETMLTNLPMFHIYGMTVCMNTAVYNASTIILNPDPRDLKSLLELIRETRPSMLPGVPTIYMRLLERDDIDDYAKDLKSIRICNTGAAPMPPEVIRDFEKRTGGKILEGYGLTECSPVTHSNPLGEGKRRVGSVGVPFPDTEVKIVDLNDDTKILPIGGEGEIMIKGPQVMKGYWNKPEETANQMKDGWVKTGDIGKMDKDGYFYIVDRKKDMIDVSGFKVYPREVEDVLYGHPAVLMASVIGIPDRETPGSEIVKAYVVLKDGYKEADELANDIKAFSKKSLAPYKVPKIVEFRKQLPESLVGKVLRKDLRAESAKAKDAEQ